MQVDQKDYILRSNPLPIKRGCFGGPCACTGRCEEVIGYIDFEVYDVFKRNYEAELDFLERNIILKEEDETVICPGGYYKITFNTNLKPTYIKDKLVVNKYLILNKLKKLFMEKNIIFPLSCIGREVKLNDPDFNFIHNNRKLLKQMVEEYGGSFVAFTE